jgi:hypothetical protein
MRFNIKDIKDVEVNKAFFYFQLTTGGYIFCVYFLIASLLAMLSIGVIVFDLSSSVEKFLENPTCQLLTDFTDLITNFYCFLVLKVYLIAISISAIALFVSAISLYKGIRKVH